MGFKSGDAEEHISDPESRVAHPEPTRFLARRCMEAHWRTEHMGYERDRREHPGPLGRGASPSRAEIRRESTDARRHRDDPSRRRFCETARAAARTDPPRDRIAAPRGGPRTA